MIYSTINYHSRNSRSGFSVQCSAFRVRGLGCGVAIAEHRRLVSGGSAGSVSQVSQVKAVDTAKCSPTPALREGNAPKFALRRVWIGIPPIHGGHRAP